MPDLQTVYLELSRDPILTYSLLATLFLAAVSLAAGWARLDFVPLLQPWPLLKLGLAVLAAALFMLLGRWLNELVAGSGWTPGGDGTGSWPFGGLGRFPLYVVALAYGPTAGLLAGALYAAFEAHGSLPGWPESVLMLELAILGWLSIFPSPREHRWAGPLNALVAYTLAWLTGGVALVQATTEGITGKAFWLAQQSSLGGALLSVLLLFLAGPSMYRSLFVRSRLQGRQQGAGAAPGFTFQLLESRPKRRLPALPPPRLPELISRRRRIKQLEAPPDLEDAEG